MHIVTNHLYYTTKRKKKEKRSNVMNNSIIKTYNINAHAHHAYQLRIIKTIRSSILTGGVSNNNKSGPFRARNLGL